MTPAWGYPESIFFLMTTPNSPKTEVAQMILHLVLVPFDLAREVQPQTGEMCVWGGNIDFCFHEILAFIWKIPWQNAYFGLGNCISRTQKEKRILQAKTKADIEKLDPYFSLRNTYLSILKKDPEVDNSSAINY